MCCMERVATPDVWDLHLYIYIYYTDICTYINVYIYMYMLIFVYIFESYYFILTSTLVN